MLVEVLSVVQTTLGIVVVGALGRRPSGLASPDLGSLGCAASDLLDVGRGLVHVVHENVCLSSCQYLSHQHRRDGGSYGVVAAGALPEGKSVDHDDISSANDSITGTVGELVPGVGGSDLDALRQLALDGADLVAQLGAGEVAAVEGLGANGDGVNGVGVAAGDIGDGLEVLLEGFLNIGPGTCVNIVLQLPCLVKHIPDTKHNLEALALRSRQNVLGGIAIRGRVSADDRSTGVALDGIKIELVILLRLAGTGRLLGAERKTHVALGSSNDSRAGRKSGRSNGGETHGGLRVLKEVYTGVRLIGGRACSELEVGLQEND